MKTFKIRLNGRGGGDDEVRRFALPDDKVTLDELRSRCAHLFGLPADRVWHFKWTDEDGDLVTLTEEYELADFLASSTGASSSPARLEIAVERPPRPHFGGQPLPFGPEHLPPFLAPFLSAAACHFGPSSVPSPHGQQGAQEPTYRARCDNTNEVLRPGDGSWYHLPGSSVDLCALEFSKLTPSDRERFELITKPDDLGDDKARYRVGCCRRGRGGGGRCGAGSRKRNTGAVAWCDVTNKRLTPGKGWYHKIGANYDVCEEAFAALSDADKGAFVRVDQPTDLGDEAARYGYVAAAAADAKQGEGEGEEPKAAAAAADKHKQPAATATPHPSRVQPEADPLSQLLGLVSEFVDVAVSDARPPSPSQSPAATPATAPATAPPAAPAMAMEVVSGPSVAAGSAVKPGARLLPVWEVRNAAADGLWTDVRLKPVAPNTFLVDENGFEGPMLEAGASGLVSVEVQVPEQLAGATDVTGEFTLVDAHGNAFGDRLTLTVNVLPSEDQQRVEEAVKQLEAMGFADHAECLHAVREAKGDVNAAALALLRKNRK